ncbi:hypothetical protein SDC9_199669 [bioreactor metagenome]|uniref:Uncharacterized protein n=1 Tax=bioreactor metagenome TaxID=1076179 RepID=A0A645IL76_9ZZZZ
MPDAQRLSGEHVHERVGFLHAGGLLGDHDGVVEILYVLQRQDAGHDLHRACGDTSVIRILFVKHDGGIVRVHNDVVWREDFCIRRCGADCTCRGQKHDGAH